MQNDGWSTFSLTDFLRPPDGWRTEHAILSTYSADLVVIVTTLLALSGCDLDFRRTGSRVELVKATETLRGRVRVLAQGGRVTIPCTPRPILKLLDRFVRTVETDEKESSWHPKVVLVRCRRVDDPTDRQWRVWIGSRNLTSAMNWEAGLILVSRADGRGQHIHGLSSVGASLAARADLPALHSSDVEAELAALTWDCPPGSDVRNVNLLGPGLIKGFPRPPSDLDRVFAISPFLDSKIVRAIAGWGSAKTHRVLVSTILELQRLWQDNDKVFSGFDHVLVQPLPDLPAEGAELLDDATPPAEIAESEEVPPAGLHAKIFFAAKGARRQLWLGSANATERGWEGRNFEVVAELSIPRNTADAIEGFIATCERFTPNITSRDPDEEVEKAIEKVRRLLSGQWFLRQRIAESELEVVASTPPPIADTAVQLEVAVFGGAWNVWPHDASCIVLAGMRRWQRTDFLQIRLSHGDKMCAWLQVAPCDPPPDEERDRALISQYLDPRTFLAWLRSLLADESAHATGGDWDSEPPDPAGEGKKNRAVSDAGSIPTVEEILRSWARDSSAFLSADDKVQTYLHELERRAKENGADADVKLLQDFRQTWNTLASELL